MYLADPSLFGRRFFCGCFGSLGVLTSLAGRLLLCRSSGAALRRNRDGDRHRDLTVKLHIHRVIAGLLDRIAELDAAAVDLVTLRLECLSNVHRRYRTEESP